MPTSSESPKGNKEQPRVNEHDSLAPAELLVPSDLQERLRRVGKTAIRTDERFRRACLYWEYALATPEFEGDDQLFNAGNEDLNYIITSDLSHRDKTKFGATVLHAYEPVFRLRAKSPYSLEVPFEIRTNLSSEIGIITGDFLDGPELTDSDYGLLSEALAILYLLESDLFPYATTWREEGNMHWKDNHDTYTLHPCEKNRIKKAPVSVKHSKRPKKSDAVVVLTVGRLSWHEAQRVGLRLWNNSMPEHEQIMAATRFATKSILDKLNGESLSERTQDFITGLVASLRDPLVKFAARPTTPDYASNAEALRKEIANREKRERKWRNEQPLTHRIQMPNS